MVLTYRFRAARLCPDFKLVIKLKERRNFTSLIGAQLVLNWFTFLIGDYETDCLYSTGPWLPDNTRQKRFSSLKQLFSPPSTA